MREPLCAVGAYLRVSGPWGRLRAWMRDVQWFLLAFISSGPELSTSESWGPFGVTIQWLITAIKHPVCGVMVHVVVHRPARVSRHYTITWEREGTCCYVSETLVNYRILWQDDGLLQHCNSLKGAYEEQWIWSQLKRLPLIKLPEYFILLPGKALPPTVKFTECRIASKHHLGPACQPDHACLSETKNGRYYLGLIFYSLVIKPFRILIFVNWLKSHSFFSVTRPVLPAIWAFWIVPPASIWRKRKPECDYRSQLDGKTTFPAQFLPWESVVGRLRKTTLMLFLPTEPVPAFTARTITTRKAFKAELEGGPPAGMGVW